MEDDLKNGRRPQKNGRQPKNNAILTNRAVQAT